MPVSSDALNEFLVRIEADTALLRRELLRAEKGVDKFEKNTNKSLRNIDRHFKQFSRLAKSSLAAFGIGFGIQQFKNLTVSAIQTADALNSMAENAGFNAIRFQTLAYAAEVSDLTFREYAEGIRRLNRRFGEFLNSGGGPAAAAIKQLGLETDIATGKIRNAEQFFDAIIAKIGDYGTAAQQSALLAQLFGDDAGPKFAQLIRQGVDALKELEEQAKGVYDEQTLIRSDILNKKLTEMGKIIGENVNKEVITLATAFGEIFGILEDSPRARALHEIEKQTNLLARAEDRLQKQRKFAPNAPTGGLEGQIALAKRRLQEAEFVERSTRPNFNPLTGETTPLETVKNSPVVKNGTEAPFAPGDAAKILERRSKFLDKRGTEIQNKIEATTEALKKLEIDALRAQGKAEEALRLAAQAQIDEWKRVAEEIPQLADEAAEGIRLINEKLAADIENLNEKLSEDAREFANAFAAAFESRGFDLLLSGKVGSAIKGLARDFAELIFRLAVLRPLAEKVANSIAGIDGGFGGGFGSFLGSIGKGLGLTKGFASGGRPPVGVPSIVGEKGPELFVPSGPGEVISNSRSRDLLGGGLTIMVDARGAVNEVYVQQAVQRGVEVALTHSNRNLATVMRNFGQRV